ncbi:MAG: hypothetical protein K0R57_3158 [Paenibacillaceae bacterium]|jgi:hypothetical protein|nr:hypothetical protein [Paenibacillaceae bacterium]
MKIALQVGTPEPEQLTAFMQTVAANAPILADGFGEASEQVIAAYDCGRLVGLGSRIETTDHMHLLKVYIAPGYECRGIGSHMEKLMLPAAERMVTAG